MPNIMVFIPAYRCEAQIGRVLNQFPPEVAKHFSEIVVVENRSPDGTLEAAKKGLQQIQGCKTTLLRNDENYSLGGSHKVAFNYCLEQGHDYLVVLHGDDQGNIQDLLPLLERQEYEQYDNLLGARFAKGSVLEGYSTFRTVGNVAFNKMISLVTRAQVLDMGSGLNMYSARFLQPRFYMGFPDDLTFNVYMLYYSIWKRVPMKFFPLTWREDDQVSNAKIFRQGWRLLGLTWQYMWNSQTLFSSIHQPSKPQYTSQSIPLAGSLAKTSSAL